MLLSIIIPAFDEEKKLSLDMQAAAEFLSRNQITGEVIIVDDGSSDRTAALAQEASLSPGIPRIVILNLPHRGKGHAIRTGILASHGEYVMFADSGLTIPFEHILKGLRLLQQGACDLALGSRKLPGSIIRREQDWDRKIISHLFHKLMVRWMHVPSHLTDTQCGFKIYRGELARTLYAECITEGFMFDIEIILRAENHGYRIMEFPVEWTCDRDSRISVRRSTHQILKEILLIRRVLFKSKSRDHT